jgi:hypothetical protein
MTMTRLFDPEPIKAQIENLIAERERIDRAINALQSALKNMEGVASNQAEFSIDLKASDTTLHDAVKRACLKMIDGITRQRVIADIEREHPFLKPKSASVAASLINLAKGEHPMLRVASVGKGRSPSFYSTEGEMTVRLSADEIEELIDPNNTKGTGGWQSLWIAVLKKFDKASGTIKLSEELRAKIYHYYHSYGSGGWQNKARKVFRRELPHIFIS